MKSTVARGEAILARRSVISYRASHCPTQDWSNRALFVCGQSGGVALHWAEVALVTNMLYFVPDMWCVCTSFLKVYPLEQFRVQVCKEGDNIYHYGMVHAMSKNKEHGTAKYFYTAVHFTRRSRLCGNSVFALVV